MKYPVISLVFATGLAGQASAQTLADYQATLASQSPDTYFKLDGALTSAVDPTVTLDVFGAGGFTFDTYRNATSSYFYVNQTDFLRITYTNLISGGGTSNLTSTASGSVTFLFRTLDSGANTGQRYLFSAGSATANHNALALFLENTNVANGDPNSIKLRFGNNTTTILQATNITPNTWYYFAVTYLESRSPNKAIWYVGRPGGTLFSGMTTNSSESVAGNASGLYIGNKETLDSAFRSPGSGQLDEFAIWSRELSAAEVNSQFGALPNRLPPPAAAYQGVVTSQTPDYYFELDGSRSNAVAAVPVLDVVGPSTGYSNDYFGNFTTTNAAAFVAVNDALVVSNNLVSGGGAYTGIPGTGKGSLSFLFYSLSGTNVSGQRFLFSAGGATGATNGFAVYMENLTAATDKGAIKIRLGNSSKPILQPQDMVLGDWYYLALTYDESLASQQVTWYLGQPGGPLKTGALSYQAGSLAGQGDILVIGNHTNFNGGWRNPGNGRLDEFAIWHRILTSTEITDQFAALAPITNAVSITNVAPPVLNIILANGNVELSWPASTPVDFVLETTNVLDSTTIGAAAWPSAGASSIVGTNYVVTNAVSADSGFYRLHKP